MIASLFCVSTHVCHGANAVVRTHTQEALDDIVSQLIDDSHCPKQVRELLANWHVTGQWVRQPGDLDGGKVLGSPTDKIGVWAGFSAYPDKSIEAYRLSPDAQVHVVWTPTKCEPKARPQPLVHDHRPGFDYVTDRVLADAASHGDVLVYNWSPHMPLSVKGFVEAQATAKKLNLKFLPVLDPESDATAARKAVADNGFPDFALKRADSLELSARGAHLHYPSTLVIASGRFSRLYPGLWVSLSVYEDFVRRAVQP